MSDVNNDKNMRLTNLIQEGEQKRISSNEGVIHCIACFKLWAYIYQHIAMNFFVYALSLCGLLHIYVMHVSVWINCYWCRLLHDSFLAQVVSIFIAITYWVITSKFGQRASITFLCQVLYRIGMQLKSVHMIIQLVIILCFLLRNFTCT